MRKLSFLLGLGVGYFFGTRAGRQQFERIRSTSRAVWQDPRVQSGVQKVEDKVGQVARDQAAAVTDKVAEAVKSRIHSSASSADEAPVPPSVEDAPMRPTPPQPSI